MNIKFEEEQVSFKYKVNCFIKFLYKKYADMYNVFYEKVNFKYPYIVSVTLFILIMIFHNFISSQLGGFLNLILYTLLILIVYAMYIINDINLSKSKKAYKISDFRFRIKTTYLFKIIIVYFIIDLAFITISNLYPEYAVICDIFITLFRFFIFFAFASILLNSYIFKIITIICTVVQGVLLVTNSIIFMLSLPDFTNAFHGWIASLTDIAQLIYSTKLIDYQLFLIPEILYGIVLNIMYYLITPKYQRTKLKISLKLVYIFITVTTVLSIFFIPTLFDNITNNKTYSAYIKEEIAKSTPSDFLNYFFLPYIPIYYLLYTFMEDKKEKKNFKFTSISNHEVCVYLDIKDVIMSETDDDIIKNEIATLNNILKPNVSKKSKKKVKKSSRR